MSFGLYSKLKYIFGVMRTRDGVMLGKATNRRTANQLADVFCTLGIHAEVRRRESTVYWNESEPYREFRGRRNAKQREINHRGHVQTA